MKLGNRYLVVYVILSPVVYLQISVTTFLMHVTPIKISFLTTAMLMNKNILIFKETSIPLNMTSYLTGCSSHSPRVLIVTRWQYTSLVYNVKRTGRPRMNYWHLQILNIQSTCNLIHYFGKHNRVGTRLNRNVEQELALQY